MPDGIVFGRKSADRIADVVRKVEHAPTNREKKRRHWPVINAAGLIPVEIVQRDDEEGDPPEVVDDEDDRALMAVHRSAPWILDSENPDAGVDVRRLSMIRNELVIRTGQRREHAFCDLMTDVLWTGKRVFAVQKFGKLWLQSGAAIWHTATTLETVLNVGSTDDYAGGQVKLWSGETEDDPDGPIVNAFALFDGSVAADTPCVVTFDDDEQRFYVLLPDCPPTPTTEE